MRKKRIFINFLGCIKNMYGGIEDLQYEPKKQNINKATMDALLRNTNIMMNYDPEYTKMKGDRRMFYKKLRNKYLQASAPNIHLHQSVSLPSEASR
jgi:hypothetical protein